MKKTLAVFIFFLLATPRIDAAAEAVFPIFDIYIGARSASLAGAFTAAHDDLSSVYWNPAALAYCKNFGISGAFNKWSLDASFEYILSAIPLPFGTVGLEVLYADMGAFDQRDEYGRLLLEAIKTYSIGGALSYGFPVAGGLTAGLTGKFSSQTIGNSGTSGILLDLGLHYRISEEFHAGLVFKNAQISAGKLLPREVCAGALYHFFINKSNILTASLDFKRHDTYGMAGSLGVEYGFSNALFLRAGYELKGDNSALGGIAGLSAGAGVKLKEFIVDYAATSYGDLGITHIATLSFIFGGETEAAVKERRTYEKLVKNLTDQYLSDFQDYYDVGDFTKAVKKLESLKEIVPDYSGLDAKISDAKGRMENKEQTKQVENYFNDGMNLYVAGKYKEALDLFNKVEKLKKDYEGIKTWIDNAKKMDDSRGKVSPQEMCFNDGMKHYNQCEFGDAVKKWNECVKAGYSDERVTIFKEKSQALSDKITKKVSEAEAFFAKGNMIDGVRKARVVASLCPANKYAKDRLLELKDEIKKESERLYLEGIDRYSSRKIVESILAWEKMLEIDPDGKNAPKARENIDRAREKLKNVDSMKMK